MAALIRVHVTAASIPISEDAGTVDDPRAERPAARHFGIGRVFPGEPAIARDASPRLQLGRVRFENRDMQHIHVHTVLAARIVTK